MLQDNFHLDMANFLSIFVERISSTREAELRVELLRVQPCMAEEPLTPRYRGLGCSNADEGAADADSLPVGQHRELSELRPIALENESDDSNNRGGRIRG